MDVRLSISLLVVVLLLFSDCCSMSIGKLNDTTDELQDDRILALENTIDRLESQIKIVNNSKVKYNSTVDEVQDDRILALENTIRKLESEIKNVTNSKDKQKEPVMFYARINRSTFTLQTLSTLVFDTVILNIGEHYDKYDGVFVAPRKGIYLFSWTVSIHGGNYAVTELIVEGRSISNTGSTDNAGGYHSASMTTLSRMNKDEHAFIRTTTYGSTNGFYSTSSNPHSSFLGMLVYDEK